MGFIEDSQKIWNEWDLKVNKQVFTLSLRNNLNEILIHHYLVNEMRFKCSYEVQSTLKEISNNTNLGIQQVRTAIDKLEEAGIIEVVKGGSKKANTYKYIQG